MHSITQKCARSRVLVARQNTIWSPRFRGHGRKNLSTILIMGFVTGHVVGGGFGSPLFAIFAVIIYGIMANICFTGGWVLELLSRRIWGTRAEAFGEIAFTWGTLCSVILTLVPAAVVVVIGACRILANGWKN